MRLPFTLRLTPFATVLVVTMTIVTGALAYFTATGSGSATGAVTSLSTPGSPAASVSGTTVTVTWNASTIGSSAAASSYAVERYSSAGTDLGAASCSPVSSSSGSPNAFGSFTCADSPGSGSFEYKITGKYHSSWSATTAFTNTVTVQNTTSLSATGPATDSSGTAITASSISATLSAAGSGAGGTITFKVFGPQASAPTSCSTGGTTVGTSSVSGNGTYNSSAGFTPSSAGTYWWYASYGGDSNNTGSATTCGSGMSSTVVKNNTTLAASGPASGNVGTAIPASSLSSTVAGGTSGASGTITYTVFGPQASAPTSCTSGGTTVGTASVAGNGTYNPSAGFTPSAPGTYWWYASYNGDGSNNASTSPCGSGMSSTSVAKANASLTAAAPSTDTTGGAIGTGSLSAALAGATSGASGTITFTVFGPQASAPSTCTTGGTTVGTASVSGNNTYNPSAGFTPSTAGTYWWYVSYNGDSNNASASSTCGTGMTSTVVSNTTAVAASGPGTDTANTAITASALAATLSGATSTATGTITYTVFGPQSTAPSSCTSGGTAVGTATVSGNGSYIPSAGFTPTSAGTYWWYVSYGGDSKNGASSGVCGSSMPSTDVYSTSSAASGGATSGTSVTTSSFTVQPSTTYLLLVSRTSSSGDGISSISSTGISPSLSSASFTSITSQAYNSSTDYQWAYWITTASNASGSGTLTINFTNTLGAGQISIAYLMALGGVNTTNPIVVGNEATASGSSTAASANLPYAPASVDSGLVFLSSAASMGATAPAASPTMTNSFYTGNSVGSAAVYAATPGARNESFTLSASQAWGSIALEIRRAGSTNSPTLSAAAPTTGTIGTAISAGFVSAALSGATSSATNGITFKVFGPQSTAPTSCTSGGTTVGGTVAVAGNNTYNPTASFTPSQAGTYWWYADYSGDANNLHTTSTCGSAMPSTVVPKASTTLSDSAPAATTSGTAISATSITSALSGGMSSPSGTITYTVFGPQASPPTTCTTGGTTVGTSTVSGNGSYSSSASFTPSSAGTYWWYASYGGDSNNASSNSGCGSSMNAMYVYSISSVIAGSGTTTSAVTSSFTVQPNTPYVLLMSRVSTTGDSVSSFSSSGLSPALTTSSFTSVGSENWNTSDWNFAYYFVSSSSASGSGTITVNFAKTGTTDLDLVSLAGASTSVPVLTGNVGTASGSTASATANLPSAPASGDAAVAFVAAPTDLSPTAPTASPAMTSVLYTHSGSLSQGVLGAAPATQNETLTLSKSAAWGAMALEISAPMGQNGNTTTTTASGPSTGTAGAAISAGSISSALSGATSGASGTITFSVFGPQSTAPTSCTSGGTTVGTAAVSGNGTYNPSAGFTPSAAGTYWWYASYTGDASANKSSASTCGTGMGSMVVGSAVTTLGNTQPAAAMSGVAVAASSITSSLSGASSSASGTITYTVFGPQASPPTTCTTGGTTVGTSTVSGNGGYSASASFTPTSAGTYWWYVSYSGDSNNAASNTGCGSLMDAMYVYSISSVVTGSGTTTSAVTSSFTVQANTPYLLLMSRTSATGDSVSSFSSTGLSPALSTASFTSVASENWNTSAWNFAYYFVSSSSASGSGTITVNFAKTGTTDLDLVSLAGASTSTPVLTGNVGTANGSGTSATANLPSAPASGDAALVLTGAPGDLGATVPAASPAMTSLAYTHSGSLAQSVLGVAQASQNETLTLNKSATWATMALEVSAPMGQNGNTTTTTVSGPSTATAGSAISASSISAALSGATSGASGTITYTVFGPQSTAPTSCTSGGTTVGTAAVSGNGTYNSSASYTPATAGTYWWYASYTGDASANKSSASTCGTGMASTVVKNGASNTVAAPSSGTAGTAITAFSITSTLSGATSAAGGTITYTVFGPQSTAPTNCTTGGTTVGTATVSGNGSYVPSGGFTPSAPGTYWWYASYSGDSSNSSSASTCGSGMTSTVVGTAATSLTAAAPSNDSPGTPISAISIGASLSGATTNASGTITFTVFGPQATAPTSCTSGGTTVGAATVSGNGTYNPAVGFTPSSAGTYWWYVSYGGDSNNASSASPCGSSMISTAVQNNTTITAAGPATGNAGAAISAGSLSAALSGATAGATGTITFKVVGPQSTAPTSCSSGTTVGTATVSGNGTFNPGAGFTPSAAGTYWWYVSYGGDSNNAPSTSTCGSGMSSTIVGTSTPAITVSAPSSGQAGTATAASSISSTLSAAASGATGTITYTVFGPQSVAPTTCSTGGTTVGTSTVSGNGTYNSSASWTPISTGVYWWYASYNGDANNGAANSGCGAAMGTTTVTATIAKVQAGAEKTGTTAAITPTLTSASHAGNLLVAVLGSYNGTSCPSYTAPTGWVKASGGCLVGAGDDEIWYYPNNPGGITSVTFTATGSTSSAAELSEWSGVATASPLDGSGSGTTSTAATSFTFSTSAATTSDGELGVSQLSTSNTGVTFTAGSGWAHLYTDTGGWNADSGLALAHGIVSEKETSSVSTTWAAAIATFKPAG